MKRKKRKMSSAQKEANSDNWMIFRLRGCIETLREAATMPAFVGSSEDLERAKLIVERVVG